MLIELLIVGVVMTFLHSMGWVDLSSVTGLATALLSMAVIFVGCFVIFQWFLGKVTDSFFGFGTWKNTRAPIVGRDIPPRLPANPTLDLLRQRASKWPADLGASRDLADQLVKLGHHNLAIQERQRFLNENKNQLQPREVCAIRYRIADSLVALGKKLEAAEILRSIVQEFPKSAEAQMASQRMHILLDNSNSLSPEPSKLDSKGKVPSP